MITVETQTIVGPSAISLELPPPQLRFGSFSFLYVSQGEAACFFAVFKSGGFSTTGTRAHST